MNKESVRLGAVWVVSLKVGGCLEMCFIRVAKELEALKKLKGILIICLLNFQLLFVDYWRLRTEQLSQSWACYRVVGGGLSRIWYLQAAQFNTKSTSYTKYSIFMNSLKHPQLHPPKSSPSLRNLFMEIANLLDSFIDIRRASDFHQRWHLARPDYFHLRLSLFFFPFCQLMKFDSFNYLQLLENSKRKVLIKKITFSCHPSVALLQNAGWMNKNQKGKTFARRKLFTFFVSLACCWVYRSAQLPNFCDAHPPVRMENERMILYSKISISGVTGWRKKVSRYEEGALLPWLLGRAGIVFIEASAKVFLITNFRAERTRSRLEVITTRWCHSASDDKSGELEKLALLSGPFRGAHKNVVVMKLGGEEVSPSLCN